MQFPSSPTESLVVKVLSGGPKKVTSIIQSVSRARNVTPENVYLAIRNLRKKRILVVTKKTASLYIFWVQNLRAFTGRIDHNYRDQYPSAITLNDVFSPRFRSRTFACPTFDSLENTFHHIAQSLLTPQERPTPYFFFGFAPWWMTLCPEDADAFVGRLISYNYVPLMIFKGQCALDKETVSRLKKLGCQIVFDQTFPDAFEGHYVHGFCLEALHPKKQYPNFLKEYQDAKPGDYQHVAHLMRQFENGSVRLSKRKNPFSKRILDQFAVAASIFQE